MAIFNCYVSSPEGIWTILLCHGKFPFSDDLPNKNHQNLAWSSHQNLAIAFPGLMGPSTMYEAYFLGLCKGISPQNMVWKMVHDLHFKILKISHWSSRLGKKKKIARWDHPHLTSNQGTRLMCRSLMALFRIALFRVALGTDVSQGSTLMKCEPLDRPNIQAIPSAGINGRSPGS